MNSRTVKLRRQINSPRCAVLHELRAGTIVLLSDPDGDYLLPYLDALRGGNAVDVSIECAGSALQGADIARAGFEDHFPDNSSIAQFFDSHGVSPAEQRQLMSQYDLERLSYLNCSQLPAVAQRQLSLFAALRSKAPLLVLQDPFQPFSGRWREQFAEELLAHVESQQRYCVVTNLSFMPTCWQERSEIVTIDLKQSTSEVLERAIGIEREEKERKIREEKAAAIEAQRAAAAARRTNNSTPPASGQSLHGETIEVIQPDSYAFRQVNDYLFAPLARLSETLRSWSGVTALLGCAVIIACMAYVFVPAFAGAHNGFGSFAAAWRDGAEHEPPRHDLNQREQNAEDTGEQTNQDGEEPPLSATIALPVDSIQLIGDDDTESMPDESNQNESDHSVPTTPAQQPIPEALSLLLSASDTVETDYSQQICAPANP